MRPLLPPEDLRRLVIGAVGVASCGLLLGAATRPDLDEHGLIPPQILTPEGAAHHTAAGPDPGLAAYGSHVPDYVIGADWTRPHAADPNAAPEPESDADDSIEVTVLAADGGADPTTLRTVWRDDPPPPLEEPALDPP